MQVANRTALAVAAPTPGTSVNSWKVDAKHGTQSGVGVSVSGQGAWAELEGNMSFQLQHLDKWKTYNELKTKYNFSAGTSGFWSWLVGGVHTSEQKTEIHKVFTEVSNMQKVQGNAHFDLSCTGIYPNVEVDASAYVLILQITDDSGNTYNMFSTSNPSGDTGAQDSAGTALHTKDNSSSITI